MFLPELQGRNEPVLQQWQRVRNTDGIVKSPFSVSPANAGVQKLLKWLDSGYRIESGTSLAGMTIFLPSVITDGFVLLSLFL